MNSKFQKKRAKVIIFNFVKQNFFSRKKEMPIPISFHDNCVILLPNLKPKPNVFTLTLFSYGLYSPELCSTSVFIGIHMIQVYIFSVVSKTFDEGSFASLGRRQFMPFQWEFTVLYMFDLLLKIDLIEFFGEVCRGHWTNCYLIWNRLLKEFVWDSESFVHLILDNANYIKMKCIEMQQQNMSLLHKNFKVINT